MLRSTFGRQFSVVKNRLREAIQTLEAKKLDIKYFEEDNSKQYNEGLHKEMNDIFNNSESYKAHKEERKRAMERESVLSSYNKSANGEILLEESRKLRDIEQRHQKAFNDFFKEEDENNRARKFEKFKDASKRGYDFSFEEHEEVNVDYNRFDLYKQNYAKTSTSVGAEEKFYEDRNFWDYRGATIRKFMETHDSNFSFKRMKNIYGNDDDYKIGDARKLSIWNTNFLDGRKQPSPQDPQKIKVDDELLDEDKDWEKLSKNPNLKEKPFNVDEHDPMDDEAEFYENWGNIMVPRLTFRARKELLRRYQDGETIRDISNKFGLLPSTTKLYIWMETTYLEHYLPYFDEEMMRMVAILETQHDKHPLAFDYGLDLQKIREMGIGEEQAPVNFKLGDTAPFKEYQQQAVDLYKQKRPASEKINEKFIGSGKTGYFIKDLKVYKGKGSQDAGPSFRHYLQNSHVKDYLPERSRAGITKGPRSAVKKMGPR